MDEDNAQVFVIDRKCREEGMRVTNFDKWVIAIIIGIVFLVFASPFMFSVSNIAGRRIGLPTTYPSGKATYFGLVLHCFIVIAIVRLLMH